MHTDLSHLPPSKQAELNAIVEAIRLYPMVEIAILFGSYARGNWVEEYEEDGIHLRYQSDFDILVIVETCRTSEQNRLEQALEKAIKALPVYYTPISLLIHDIKFVNKRLGHAQYFFSDIKKQGVVLYDSGKFKLATPRELTYAERYRLAKGEFDYWFSNADEFYELFNIAFERKSYNPAAFLLHQTTERLYSGILLVFTRYKPNTHNLKDLRNFVNALDPQFVRVFALRTLEEQQLFTLLCKAYVHARYNKDYIIAAEELARLAKQVHQLRQLGEYLCQGKIQYFLEQSITELQIQPTATNIATKKDD